MPKTKEGASLHRGEPELLQSPWSLKEDGNERGSPRLSLGSVTELTGRLDQSLDVNAENIDELLENMRHVTENLKEFTDTIKTKPYTLIRSSAPREHKPGESQ